MYRRNKSSRSTWLSLVIRESNTGILPSAFLDHPGLI